jgi:hypothetical protein
MAQTRNTRTVSSALPLSLYNTLAKLAKLSELSLNAT